MFDPEVKKKKETSEPAWMLTFADLVSLLICFFVLLYSMKSVNEDVWQKITGSFVGALSHSQKFKKIEPNSDSAVETEKFLSLDGLEYTQSVLYKKFEKHNLLSYVNFSRLNKDNSLIIEIQGSILFNDDFSKLTEDGKKILSFLNESIQYLKEDIEVVSYVKDKSALKADPIEISLLRSLEIYKYLLRHGATKDIKIVGYGGRLYNDMKILLPQDELLKTTVKVEFILRTKQ